MREIPFEEARKIQLNILIWFDNYCRENNLNYSLGEGTLIGAIRHKGFIPWDDDIDLLMPRGDYDRFIADYKGDKYRLISLRTDKKWYSCYSRLTDESTLACWNNPKLNYHGLWISLLPIDNYPDDNSWWECNKRKLNFYLNMARAKESWWYNGVGVMRNIFKFIVRIILYPVSYNHIGESMEKLLVKYNGRITQNKGQMACVWHKPWVFPANLMDEYVNVPFENYHFKALKGYDQYLRCQYGDYMQLPPVEKRVPQHEYKAYYKD